jgi:serine protease Do
VVLLGLVLTLSSCDRLGKGKGTDSESSDRSEPRDELPSLPSAAPLAPIDLSSRPMSFAPLVQRVDPSVAQVKARLARGEGMGTAFVYDSAGFLLTNHHVIEGAKQIRLTLVDDRELEATVVGSDKRTDVAVLKVEERGLPALPLGNSDDILIGDWVVAIGHPFGLSHTVSAGILSARGRTREDVNGLDPSGYFSFLQTDASINPGNSGGPLLNLRGEVVGINSAIRANANGIAFTIPINMVKDILPILLKYGSIRRSALGVVVGDMKSSRSRDHRGALIKDVQGGSPAAAAGIKVDDVIIAFNGKPVDNPEALRWYASIAGVGQPATVKVLRGGKEREFNVTLTALPETN